MFIPVQNNEIPEPPLQLVDVILSNYKRLTICARFAKNLKADVKSYRKHQPVTHRINQDEKSGSGKALGYPSRLKALEAVRRMNLTCQK